MLTEYFRNLLNLEGDESMNVFEAIQKRREITKFSDKTIPKDSIGTNIGCRVFISCW